MRRQTSVIIPFQFPLRGNTPETALINTAAFLQKAKKEGLSADGLPVSYGLRFAPGLGLPSLSAVSGARPHYKEKRGVS
jgi:hypothetical protein